MVRSSAVIKSVVFHVVVVGGFFVSMPFLSRDIAPEQPILTVDIVNTLPETSLDEGVKAKVEPKAPEVKAEEPKAESPKAPPPPAPPPPAPPPAPEPAPSEALETAEAVPVPSVKPKPVKAPKPKAKAPPKPVKAPPKRPTQKSPEFKKRQQEQAQLTSKLQDLTERQARLKREQAEKEKKKKAAEEKMKKLLAAKEKKDKEAAERKEAQDKLDQLVGQALNVPRRNSAALGVSQTDLLRNHIAQCWNPPAGASGADALNVDIIVRLNKRAEVKTVEIVDEARMKSDRTFKAAALAARRAVVECSPLPLPLDSYDTWKELQFEFNPRFITRS